jgi:phage shock protein C
MKTLYRSRDQKIISGVAGGLGEYFDIDPVFMRVLFIITTISGGIGLLAYIVLWIIVPYEPFEYYQKKHSKSTEPNYSDFGTETTTGNTDYVNTDYSNTSNAQPSQTNENKQKIRFFGGTFLILLGLIILLDNIIPGFDFTFVWSIILIMIGGYILFSNKKWRKTDE